MIATYEHAKVAGIKGAELGGRFGLVVVVDAVGRAPHPMHFSAAEAVLEQIVEGDAPAVLPRVAAVVRPA